MFGKKPPKPQTRIDSLIGAGTRIEGNVIFAGGLRIDGEVKGDVRCAEDQAGTLVISEHARVEGEIAVAHLVVNGTIVGPVHATDFVELQPRSRVTGDVHYASSRCTSARSSTDGWCTRALRPSRKPSS